jgi:hypothetical protein
VIHGIAEPERSEGEASTPTRNSSKTFRLGGAGGFQRGVCGGRRRAKRARPPISPLWAECAKRTMHGHRGERSEPVPVHPRRSRGLDCHGLVIVQSFPHHRSLFPLADRAVSLKTGGRGEPDTRPRLRRGVRGLRPLTGRLRRPMRGGAAAHPPSTPPLFRLQIQTIGNVASLHSLYTEARDALRLLKRTVLNEKNRWVNGRARSAQGCLLRAGWVLR